MNKSTSAIIADVFNLRNGSATGQDSELQLRCVIAALDLGKGLEGLKQGRKQLPSGIECVPLLLDLIAQRAEVSK